MEIPPEAIIESQVAYRQIQRFQKSSPPILIAVIFLLMPLMEIFHLAPATGREISLGGAWITFSISLLFVLLHFWQHRSLNKKAETAHERLNHLYVKYGPEIGVVSKKSSSLSAKRKMLLENS